MLASINDLRKGDTVLVCLGSVLAEVKILRQPQLAKQGKKVVWNGTPRWTSLLCALRQETFSYKSINGNYTWTKTVPVVADGKEYNVEKRIDFTEKICWIIKREKE